MRGDRRWLSVVVLVSLGLRLATAIALGDRVEILPGIFDQISYHTLALRLLGGYGFTFDQLWWPITPAGSPTAHWSYLYTVWLAAVYGFFGLHPIAVRVIQALLAGTLMPYLTYRIARRVLPAPASPEQPHWAALAAAAWSAAYGYFIYYTAAIMTEAFFMTALLWSLDCALRLADHALAPGTNEAASRPANRWTWLELGLALAVTAYLRQVFSIFVPVLLAWLGAVELAGSAGSLRDRLRATWRRVAEGTLLAGGLLALLIAPTTLFNYHQFNRFELLNTNAGYAFFWANHPIYGDHFVAILPNDMPYTDLIPTDLRALNINEAELDSALMQRGIGFVLADPARYVRLSFSRIPVYFMFWPSSDSGPLSNLTRVASFGLALPFMLTGLGLWISDWIRPGRQVSAWRSSLLVLFIVVYSSIHILSWALTRYRLPVDAVGLIFASRAVVGAGRRVLRGGRSNATSLMAG